MSIWTKIYTKIAILADQEEALRDSYHAYRFALLNIPGTDIEKCQKCACNDAKEAYYFARDIPGANIEYCQEHVNKDAESAYWFARNIPGADIEYCRKACESNPEWLKEFDKMIAEKVLA